MSSLSDVDIAEMLESGQELVTFSDVPNVISCDRAYTLNYTVGRDVTTRPSDWVGLFRSGWATWRDFVRFTWAQRVVKRNRRRSPPEHKVTFRKTQLLGLHFDGSYFQFVYVSRDNDILGVSGTFFLVAGLHVYDLLSDNAQVTSVEDDFLDGFQHLFTEAGSRKQKRRTAKQRRSHNRQPTLRFVGLTTETSMDTDTTEETITDCDSESHIDTESVAIQLSVESRLNGATTVTCSATPQYRVSSVVQRSIAAPVTTPQPRVSFMGQEFKDAPAITPDYRVASVVQESIVEPTTPPQYRTSSVVQKSIDAPVTTPDDSLSTMVHEPAVATCAKKPISASVTDTVSAATNQPNFELNVGMKHDSDLTSNTQDAVKTPKAAGKRRKWRKKEKNNKIVTNSIEISTEANTIDNQSTGEYATNTDIFTEDSKPNKSGCIKMPTDWPAPILHGSTSGTVNDVNQDGRERCVSCSNSEPVFEDCRRRPQAPTDQQLSPDLATPREIDVEFEEAMQANLMAMSLELQEAINTKEETTMLQKENALLRAELDDAQNQLSEYVNHETEQAKSCEAMENEGRACSHGYEAVLDKHEKTKLALIRRQEKTFKSLHEEVTSRINQCELLKVTSKKLNNDLDKRDREMRQAVEKIEALGAQLDMRDKDIDTLTKNLVASRTSVKSLTEIFATTEKDLKEHIRRLQVKLATRTLSAKKRLVNVGEVVDSPGVVAVGRPAESCPKTIVNKKRKLSNASSESQSSSNESVSASNASSQNHVKDEPAVNDLSDFSHDINVQATQFQAIDETDCTTRRRKPPSCTISTSLASNAVSVLTTSNAVNVAYPRCVIPARCTLHTGEKAPTNAVKPTILALDKCPKTPNVLSRIAAFRAECPTRVTNNEGTGLVTSNQHAMHMEKRNSVVSNGNPTDVDSRTQPTTQLFRSVALPDNRRAVPRIGAQRHDNEQTNDSQVKQFRVLRSLESLRRQADACQNKEATSADRSTANRPASDSDEVDGHRTTKKSTAVPVTSQPGLPVPYVVPNNLVSLIGPMNQNRCLEPAESMVKVWTKMANLASETCRYCGIIISGSEHENLAKHTDNHEK